MKTETIISNINTELIRTFATLDAWFDRVLDDDFDEGYQWDMHEVLQHILISNDHLLDLLSSGCDYAIAEFSFPEEHQDSGKEFIEMRFALRKQLYQCLCLLDELESSDGNYEDTNKQMNIYDRLWSITHHLNYHLEKLEKATVTG